MRDEDHLLHQFRFVGREVAAGDMANMGLSIVSFTIRDIRDTQGYLDALCKPRIAQVKRDAQIAQAEADRDAMIKSSQATQAVQEAKQSGAGTATVLARGAEITDANAAIFDVIHEFRGCIPGIHEVLRRQGLLAGRWCLYPDEVLSEGQLEEIERVHAAYPLLNDDHFVAEHLDQWLS